VEWGVRNWGGGNRGGVGCGRNPEPEIGQQCEGEGGVERGGREGDELEAGVLPSEVKQRVVSDESAQSEARKGPEKETFEDEDAVLVEREETQAQILPEGESSSSEKRTAKPDTVDDVGGGREETLARTEMASGFVSSPNVVVVHLDVSDMADQYPFWS